MLLYRPEAFQGNLNKENYFEGWYFKNVSARLENVFSFIPGISLAKGDQHAFIQVIDGISGKTEYIEYPLHQFSYNRNGLFVKIGKSTFTADSISLDIDDDRLKVSGELHYRNRVSYPRRILSPGIMGWYSFVPFMECKHGIVSVNSDIAGSLKIKNETIDFGGGKGYTEKDWGTSFPEAWLWCQANNFDNRTASLFLSVAKIPWLGRYFTGLISFLYIDGKFYLYSTYNKSVIKEITRTGDKIDLTLRNSDTMLRISVNQRGAGKLKAPVRGKMSRVIKESIDSDVSVELYDLDGKKIFADRSSRAGLEIIEEIFGYINEIKQQ